MKPIVLYKCSKSTRPIEKLGSKPFSTLRRIICLTQCKACKLSFTRSRNSFKYSSSVAVSKANRAKLIVDTLTGKQYVGSAYGDECIWQRWSNYAKDGHGGNVELKELLTLNGEEYKYNFKYSILEVCNMNLGNEYIISRETHWKEVLMTRKFGLNKN